MAERHDLTDARVLVTAGGTRQPIDPVRYLGNRSSGKMGAALAQVAAELGAHVTLITTVDAPKGAPPPNTRVVLVETAEEMHEAVRGRLADTDVLLMAAAVADWRAADPSPTKLKKRAGEWSLRLVPAVDILAALRDAPERARVYVVGFAAETDDHVSNALAKLRDKGLDLIVVNDVGRPDIGMGADDNEVTVVDAQGPVAHIARAPKPDVAREILRIVAGRLPR